MSSENLHQDGDGQDPSHQTGDGSGEALETLFAEGETAEDFVKRVNEKAGTTYEDLDALTEGLKNSNALSAELGRLKKEKSGDGGDGKTTTTTTTTDDHKSDDVTELFFDQNEDAARVKADLERVAKSQGRSVIQVWKDKDESWLHEKSDGLRKAAEARDRVADPSGKTRANNNSEEALISKRLSGNLPPGFSAETPQL